MANNPPYYNPYGAPSYAPQPPSGAWGAPPPQPPQGAPPQGPYPPYGQAPQTGYQQPAPQYQPPQPQPPYYQGNQPYASGAAPGQTGYQPGGYPQGAYQAPPQQWQPQAQGQWQQPPQGQTGYPAGYAPPQPPPANQPQFQPQPATAAQTFQPAVNPQGFQQGYGQGYQAQPGTAQQPGYQFQPPQGQSGAGSVGPLAAPPQGGNWPQQNYPVNFAQPQSTQAVQTDNPRRNQAGAETTFQAPDYVDMTQLQVDASQGASTYAGASQATTTDYQTATEQYTDRTKRPRN